jgi:hypothetical protein
MRCLARDPSQRFASAAELASALRRCKSRPLRWYLAGAAALVLVAVCLALIQPWRKPALSGGDKPRSSPEVRPVKQPPRRDFALKVVLEGGRYDAERKLHLLEDGQFLSLRVEAGKDCYLGVWNVTASGKVIQLFPNDAEPDNHLKAGEVKEIPDHPRTRIKAHTSKGPEQIHVVASTRRWREPEGRRLGPFAVFDTEKEKADWRGLVRGLRELELADLGAQRVAEEVLPIRVLPRQE